MEIGRDLMSETFWEGDPDQREEMRRGRAEQAEEEVQDSEISLYNTKMADMSFDICPNTQNIQHQEMNCNVNYGL